MNLNRLATKIQVEFKTPNYQGGFTFHQSNGSEKLAGVDGVNTHICSSAPGPQLILLHTPSLPTPHSVHMLDCANPLDYSPRHQEVHLCQ